MNVNNQLPLIYWLIDNTKINNDKFTNNKQIKETFIKKYPEYESSFDKSIYFKIGVVLNMIYGNELIKTKTTDGVFYNIDFI